MPSNLTYFSMFSGIGGFELGIQKAIPESKCVGYSEIDKYATAIYRYHFPDHKGYGDATRIDYSEVPDCDFLVGGFPCQAFSIAGKREGFQDVRGTLFFEIVRFCTDKRPRYILLENVQGLLSHENGETFQRILGVLSDCGYILQWEAINSKNYGVPQSRPRVYFVGHLRGECRPEVFPIIADGGEDGTLQRQQKGERTGASCLGTRYGERWSDETYILDKNIDGNVYRYDEHTPPLRSAPTNYNMALFRTAKPDLIKVGAVVGPGSTKRIDDNKELSRNYREGQRVYGAEGLASAITVNKGYYGQATGLYQVSKGDHQNENVYGDIGISPALIAHTTGGNDRPLIECDHSIRRLTPVECERLQSFPDNWTQRGVIDDDVVKISDTQRYKCLGNAVTTNVIAEIMRRLYLSGGGM